MKGRRRFVPLWLLLAALLCAACAPITAPESAAPTQGAARFIVPEDGLKAQVLEAEPDFTGCPEDPPGMVYGPRDSLGRATWAYGVLTPASLDQGERPDLSGIALPGLQNAWYDFVPDGWVYNRCHLIGHRFGGASEPENLIVGTHALNYAGMLPWEDRIARWLRERGGRVRYKVTPRYRGDALVCEAVLLEARAADGGLSFSVLCPNVQPGVAIDYETGYTTRADDWREGGTAAGPRAHVVNRRTGKFHLADCPEVAGIWPGNREAALCPREDLLRRGLVPCGKCRP